jgi:hypothetical protein
MNEVDELTMLRNQNANLKNIAKTLAVLLLIACSAIYGTYRAGQQAMLIACERIAGELPRALKPTIDAAMEAGTAIGYFAGYRDAVAGKPPDLAMVDKLAKVFEKKPGTSPATTPQTVRPSQ